LVMAASEVGRCKVVFLRLAVIAPSLGPDVTVGQCGGSAYK